MRFVFPHPFHVPVGSVDEISRFIRGLDHKRLPETIDDLLLKERGCQHNGNLDALRFLSFVTEDDRPTGLLMLVAAKNGDPTWTSEFWRAVVWAYGPCLHGMDPSFCTAEALLLHFQAHLARRDEYAQSAVRLFLDLRKAVGPRIACERDTSATTPQEERFETPNPANQQVRVPLPGNRQALITLPEPIETHDMDVLLGSISALKQSLSWHPNDAHTPRST